MAAHRRGAAKARRGVLALALAAGIAFSACTRSGYNYVKSSENGTYFKLPSAWRLYDEKDFFRTRELSPQRKKAEEALSWTVAFDADHKPSLKHLKKFVTKEPFGLAQVRPLQADERETFSISAMRNEVVSVDTASAQGVSIDVLKSEEFTRAGGFHGLRFAFSLKAPKGGFATFDQITMVDSSTRHLYLIFVSCSSQCYETHKDTINTVMQSWTVRET